MSCQSCAEKAKRRRAEFLKRQNQKPNATKEVTTSEYNEALKKLRK